MTDPSLMEMYFLVDKLESVLTRINPIKNIKNSQDMVVLQSMLSKCITTRKYLNKKYQNEQLMIEFDDFGDQVTKAFIEAYNK